MLRRVKVKSLPRAKNGGVSYNQLAPMFIPNENGNQRTQVRDTLTSVPREEANLEAEGGETALVPNVGGLPAHYKIKGSRHTSGGVPLNLPNESFIFSDTKAMIIKDPDVLAEFGETKPMTPAKIAKKYDINKYREILADPDMDKRSKETAEKMISNYNIKLGKLATYQESMKGFDGGIPTVSLPYLEKNGINPQDILPLKPQQQAPQQEMLEGEMYAEQNPTEEQFEDEQDMPEAQFGGSRLGRRIRDFFSGSRQFDPTTGIYMNTDAQGRVFYVDGRGVQMPGNITLPQGFMAPGTVVGNNQPTGAAKSTTTKTKTVTKSTASKAKVDESKVKKADDPNLKVGDYYRDADGKLRKVTKVGYSKTPVGATYSGAEDYKPKYNDLEGDVSQANAIMEDLASQGFAEKTKNGWVIYAGAKDKLDIREKDFLTRLASYNKAKGLNELGAPGFKIASQSQYLDKTRKKKVDNGFYGFADPQMLELRYWQATNPKGTYEDFEKMDDAAKIKNRKGMLALYGYDVEKLGDKINDPSKLYTKEFVTDPKNGLTARNERAFKGNDAKTFRSADDAKIGLDHLDAYTLAPEYGNELIDETEEPSDEIETETLDDTYTGERDAPYWKQDVVKMAGAFGDLNRIKKYTPWAPKLAPYIPDPTFYDPTRELANLNEQLAIGTQGAGAFAPAQSYNARQAEMQAQGAKSAADILGRYNNLNVGAANQFELTKANLLNQTSATNADIAKTLYDQMTIANQQYDNAKAQARQELRQSYVDAITNRAQAQALNETYGDHYMVDPASGGYVTFTGKTKDLEPSNPYNEQMASAFRNLKDQFPDVEDSVLIKLMGADKQTNYADDYMKALASMYPAQTGAGYGQYYEQG